MIELGLPYAASRTRMRAGRTLARPYICVLIVLNVVAEAAVLSGDGLLDVLGEVVP